MTEEVPAQNVAAFSLGGTSLGGTSLGASPVPILALLEELKHFMVGVTLAVHGAVLSRAPVSEYAAYVDSPRLRAELGKLLDQILETRVDIDQLRSGRGHPPSKSTLVRSALFQAMRECGIAEDLIVRVYDRFQANYEPASLSTQRVRRARAKKAMSEPVAKAKPMSITKAKPK
jgi:hypothetical protein